MGNATARHYLNGLDVYETYGVIISGGSASFLGMPKRKEGLAYEWPDENGTQRDLATAVFEEKQVLLSCALKAADIDDFWAKRLAFQQQLNRPGWQLWRVMDNNRDYKVRFISETNPRKLTNPFKGQSYSGVIFQFDLTLGVDVETWLQIHGAGIFFDGEVTDGRLMEDGDYRITELGEYRILEA